jgi:hypothetical protein
LVRRIEALAAAGREPELREARDALDAAVARLYGLTASETHCVERGAPP